MSIVTVSRSTVAKLITSIRRSLLSQTGRYVIFIGLFGLVGTIVLTASHAGTFSGNKEAENGTLGTCTTQVSDATASSGLAVKLGSCSSNASDPTNLDATGATIPDTNYAIPSGAVFMDDSGSDANSGTQAAPVKTLNRAIALAPSGGTVVIRGGTYRDWYTNGTTTYAGLTKSLTFQAYPHEQVWFDGTDVEPTANWTANGTGQYAMSWSTPSFCANNYYLYAYNNQSGSAQNPANGNAGPCAYYDTYGEPTNPAAADPQMVFKDGTYIHEAVCPSDITTLPANNFCYQEDLANKTGTIYLGFNPSGHTVELAARPMALQIIANNTVVRGIGFKRYGTNTFSNTTHGAVAVAAQNVTIENDVFKQMAGEALAGGGNEANGVVAHSVLVNNGYTALGWNGHQHSDGSADNLVIRDSLFNGNNTELFDTGCSASCGTGNIKLAHMDGFTVKNNIIENVHGNGHGEGFWCDLACSGGVIVNNLVRGNAKDGIMYEVSDSGIIASNMIYDNGGYGIRNAAANTKIYNNTIVNSHVTATGGLWLYDDNRSYNYADSSGHVWTDVGPDTTNVSFANNIIEDTQNGNTILRAQGQVTNNTNTVPNQFFSLFDYNSYYQTSSSQYLMRWIAPTETDYKSLPAFTAAESGLGVSGFEAHSSSVIGGSDPFFSDLANGNYAVRTTSTAYHSGTTIPADVAAALGISTAAGQSRGAFSWPGQ